MTASPAEAAFTERKLLVLELGGDSCCVDLARVREIVPEAVVAAPPQASLLVCGTTSVAGRAIPVVDLRQRLGLGTAGGAGAGDRRALVVVSIDGREVGLGVSRAAEVLRIPRSAIQPPARRPVPCRPRCVAGMARLGGRLIPLLDLELLFTGLEQRRLHTLAAAA